MASARKTIPGSERPAPSSPPVSAPDAREQVEVSVYLKRAPAKARISREALHERRDPEMRTAMEQLASFAEAHSLTITERHAGRGVVKLAGPASALEQAFGTQLQMFDGPSGAFRARSGPLSPIPALPRDVGSRM